MEAGQVPSQRAMGLLVSGVRVTPEALAPHFTHHCLF